MNDIKNLFPPLHLDKWSDTKNTLHLFVQIIGKIRLKLCPHQNHWWHAALYISPRGLTTRSIPYEFKNFEIELDLLDHKAIITTDEDTRSFPLYDGLTVAEFYKILFTNLNELGIKVKIKAVPYDIFSKEPFETDTIHSAYDKEYIERFCRILIALNGIFEEFRGRFNGKSTPVHVFWHSFDLALTRFSGRTAPVREGTGKVDREAYSHEVISFGFWAGDNNIPAPAFYSYTFPEPESLTKESLEPEAAYWGSLRGGAIALLMYDDVRKSDSPDKVILDFLESAYRAGIKSAGWS
jgi:hypothetical protein